MSLVSISAAEFGDKTQLGLIMLAATLRKPRALFLGMLVGYIIVAGAAVLLGQAMLVIIPLSTLVISSGIVFVVVGLLMFKLDTETNPKETHSRNPFQAASLMIVLTEFGDKTQIVTIALAARFAQPIAVFFGVMLAFVIVDGLSILLAGRIGKRLPTRKVKTVSAFMFIVLGILTLLGIL